MNPEKRNVMKMKNEMCIKVKLKDRKSVGRERVC